MFEDLFRYIFVIVEAGLMQQRVPTVVNNIADLHLWIQREQLDQRVEIAKLDILEAHLSEFFLTVVARFARLALDFFVRLLGLSTKYSVWRLEVRDHNIWANFTFIRRVAPCCLKVRFASALLHRLLQLSLGLVVVIEETLVHVDGGEIGVLKVAACLLKLNFRHLFFYY